MVCLYKYIQSKKTPRSDDSNQEVVSNDSNQERVSYDSRSGSVDLQFNQNMRPLQFLVKLMLPFTKKRFERKNLANYYQLN